MQSCITGRKSQPSPSWQTCSAFQQKSHSISPALFIPLDALHFTEVQTGIFSNSSSYLISVPVQSGLEFSSGTGQNKEDGFQVHVPGSGSDHRILVSRSWLLVGPQGWWGLLGNGCSPTPPARNPSRLRSIQDRPHTEHWHHWGQGWAVAVLKAHNSGHE